MKGLTARAPDESNYVPGAGSDSELRRELGMMADVYFALFAKLPGVLRLGFPMREAKKHGMPLDRTDLALLHQRTASLYRELQDWAVDLPRLFPAPTEVPSQDPGSLFPTVLRYDNVWYGPLYMGYWATLLVVQWSLALSCEELGEACPPFALSSDELVRSILRSLETVGEGVMGGYRIGYSVRVVYDFADLPTQLWIRTLLQGHEKVFAGLRVDAFPSAGSNAMTG
jgi:hypothetical protein